MKWLYSALAILLLAFYIISGIRAIDQTGITTDEIAHIGAAYAYSTGHLANIEHPPLMKFVNSFVFKHFDTNYPSDIPIFSQYQIGDYVIKVHGKPIIDWSRYIYFTVNVLILSWILFQGLVGRLLTKMQAGLFGIFLALSPSVSPHTILVTFDTISSGFGVISLIYLYHFLSSFKTVYKTRDFYWSIFFAWLAMMVKFSMIILVPVLAFAVGYSIYSFRDKIKTTIFFKNILVITSSLVLLTSLILGFASRNESLAEQCNAAQISASSWRCSSNLAPLNMYVAGAIMTESRSVDRPNIYLNGGLYPRFSDAYFRFLFIYKESIIFVIALIFIFGFIIAKFLRDLFTKYIVTIQTDKILPIMIVGLFPLIYILNTMQSELSIGYRHFFPIVYLLYLVVGIGLAQVLNSVFKSRLYIVVSAILIPSLLLISISSQPLFRLSAVSELWRQDKWKLVGDSSYYWGQADAVILAKLVQNGSITPQNLNNWCQNRPITLELEAELYSRGVSYQGFEGKKIDGCNIVGSPIWLSNKQYMILDASSMQYLYSYVTGLRTDQSNVAVQNYYYILSRARLIDKIDGEVWVYQVR